jgi:hypothetical protein
VTVRSTSPEIAIDSMVVGLTPYPETSGTLLTSEHLCPDLLRYEQIGEADGWRGRTVRGFFWLMRAWPT